MAKSWTRADAAVQSSRIIHIFSDQLNENPRIFRELAEDVSEHQDPQKHGWGFRKLQKGKKNVCILRKK